MIKTVIPKDMDFFSEVEKLGGIERSIDVYENAQQQAIFAGQTIHFFFSQCDAADFRDSFTRFGAIANLNGSGTTIAFQQSITCTMNRVRLLSGATVLFDLVGFNTFYENWINSNGINAITSTLNIQMATSDSLATRQANATNASKVYTVYLGWVCDILNKIVPISLFSNKQLHLEIILETPSMCLTTDSVNPTFSITSPQYHYKQITFTNSYKSMLDERLAQGPITILYLNYSNNSYQVPIGTTNSSITLPWKFSRFLGFNCIARTVANISNLTYDGKFVNYNNAVIFVKDNVRLNGIYYPADAVNGNVEAFDQYLEFHNKCYNIDVNAATAWTTDPGLFEMAINVNQHPKHLVEDDLQIQGQDTSSSSSTITHNVFLNTGGTSANQQWDYYAQFFSTITITSGGNTMFAD